MSQSNVCTSPSEPVRLPSAFRVLAVATLLRLFTLQLVHVARLYSLNWDEAHHLYDGWNIWTHHDYRANAEVPPLVKLTAALPLLPLHLQAPPDQGQPQTEEAFLDGRHFVFSNGGDRVLLPARLMCTLLTVLLAGLVYLLGRTMFGDLPALLALTLFVVDPNLLAHGTLISTDVGSALLLFASVFAFYRYGQAPPPPPRPRTAGPPGRAK